MENNMANTLLLKDGPGLKDRVSTARKWLTDIDVALAQGNSGRVANRMLDLGNLLAEIWAMVADGQEEVA